MTCKKSGKSEYSSNNMYEDEVLSVSQKKKRNTKIDELEKTVTLKTELHQLAISDDAKKMILEALKFIHGEEFSIKNLSSYRDKEINLSKKFWVERSNLVITSFENYSLKPKIQEPLFALERTKKFAMSSLTKYGFHGTHCEEALNATSWDVGAAYELLMSKYFVFSNDDGNDGDEGNCVDRTGGLQEAAKLQRSQEIEVLQSIYGNMFEERIANQLWVMHLTLPYLAEHYSTSSRSNNNRRNNKCKSGDNCSEDEDNGNHCVNSIKSSVNVKNRNSISLNNKNSDVCRHFMKGTCKFGDRCRHLHPKTNVSKPVNIDESLENNKCILEIKIPKDCHYPIKDSALVSFYSVKSILSSEVCLRLSRHMLVLMKENVERDSPCVYSLVDFLENHPDVVLSVAESKEWQPIDANTSLFANADTDGSGGGSDNNYFDHNYFRDDCEVGKPKRSVELDAIALARLRRADDELCRRFRNKQNEPAYRMSMSRRKELPAWSKKADIMEKLSTSQVLIVSGETGCGKSTQVPQFILDEWLLNRVGNSGSHVNIMCTQPRRLSALAVASRVAEERIENVGNMIGYQIRLESRMSSKTRLLFCTTGILLRRFETDPHIPDVTHIIVDEVHERSEESDFLLLILKDLLPLRPDLKLILMSATLNANLFSEYFNGVGVPIIDIPGRTFPVEELYLEDVMDSLRYVLEEDTEFCRASYPGKDKDKSEDNLLTQLQTWDIQCMEGSVVRDTIDDDNLTLRQLCYRYRDYSRQTCKNLFLMDHNKINYELIENALIWITHELNLKANYPKTGSILVFLPGIQEITTMLDRLQDNAIFNRSSRKFDLIPLHSSLKDEEQARVFKKHNNGVRKIVLSTNIAETSITIDDCVFVIDAGKMKEKRFDSNKNMESLETSWVSRANAAQRKGRAGRVMPGICLRMYTKHRFEYQMAVRPLAEIHRVPLEQLIIRIKVLPVFANKTVKSVFEGMLEPPLEGNILSSLKRLQAVGAVDKNDSLTSLGQHLGALPVDVRIGKLILYGAIFCCLDSALTIAACLSYRSPFVTSFKQREVADVRRKEFTCGKSDQLTILKAFNVWRQKREKSRALGNLFANENYMSLHTLTTMIDMKYQFLELLVMIGFIPKTCQPNRSRSESGLDRTLELTGSELNANCSNQNLLISILCAALYPNIVKILTPEKNYTMSASGAVPKLPTNHEIKFKTKSDGYVHLHPTSINYSVRDFPSPYLIYQEKVRTSRVFIRDSSMVPVLPLVLFSGSKLEVQLNSGTFFVSLEDGWILFSTESNEVAELLQALQIELFKVLEEKTEDPRLDLLTYPKGKKIISTIIYLVSHG